MQWSDIDISFGPPLNISALYDQSKLNNRPVANNGTKSNPDAKNGNPSMNGQPNRPAKEHRFCHHSRSATTLRHSRGVVRSERSSSHRLLLHGSSKTAVISDDELQTLCSDRRSLFSASSRSIISSDSNKDSKAGMLKSNDIPILNYYDVNNERKAGDGGLPPTLATSPPKKPLDETHTPKTLKIHDGSMMRNVSATNLVHELHEANISPTSIDEPRPLPETTVLCLYTGGTIGMRTHNGVYSPKPGYLPEVLRTLPPLNDRHFIERSFSKSPVKPYALPPVRLMKKRVVYWIVEYEPLLDSCDMTFDDWIRIASDIRKAYNNYDGFVVLHGTDTLAYTASALSFMMENLGKPVIITGSQIPVAEVRSDGMENLIGALIIAGNFDIPEVCVYFNNKLMRGNRTIKLDNAALEAFESPNMPPLARMNINIQVNYDSIFRNMIVSPFTVHENLCRDVGLLRIFPSMSIESVRAFLQPPTRGVVLQTFGAGNMPSKRKDIIEALTEAVNRGCLVINCSQCVKGQVDVNYATGKILYDIGVIPGSDMTSEAAMTKLCYVLGKDEWDLDTKRMMLQSNLRGEMTITTDSILTREIDIVPHIAKCLRLSSGEEVQLIRETILPPLFCNAAKMNKPEILKQLKEAGVNFSIPDYNLRTALHVAASNGNIDAVQYLLSIGVNVHVKDLFGYNPLLCAVKARALKCVEAIRTAGGIIDMPKCKLGVDLCLAASHGDIEILKCWAAAGSKLVETDYDNRSALHLAASHGQLETVRYLLDQGLDPEAADDFGTTPISEATRKNFKKVLDELKIGLHQRENNMEVFKMEDNKDLFGYNPLLCAVKARALKCVEAIRTAGGIIDMPKCKLGVDLCLAASHGDIEKLKCWAAAGSKLVETDYDNRSALHLAASHGQLETVRYLLDQGLDPEAADDFGTTPISEATRKNFKKVLDELKIGLHQRENNMEVFKMEDNK